MDYYGIGFSNIRLPNNSNSYIYKYNKSINQFLHSLERTAKEYGYEIPELHSYEQYGYKNEMLVGQKKWYTDYMNKNIKTTSEYVGLPEQVYNLKPVKSSAFKYAYTIEEFKQPENIIEELKEIFTNLINRVKYLDKRQSD